MLSFNLLIFAAMAYVVFLFAVAFAADRMAVQRRGAWLRSSTIYTLSLSVYCTAWTFYGAVGNAARSGLEFMTIYLGPTLVLVGWWLVLRKLVRIGRSQRITSIADLISSRFGKSTSLGMLVTLIAVIASTPYVALQLQSVTLSLAVFADGAGSNWGARELVTAAFWVAAGLAIFTILFGTRNLDANERHHGIVMAIAVEAVVKLFALVAVGAFVVWGLGGGVSETLAKIDETVADNWQPQNHRWVGLTFLAAAAFLSLPRMFHVLVVENSDERHLATASWAFPLYLMAMSLFVLPIAVIGLSIMPEGSNPDLFVVTVPLSEGRNGLAILAFLGGFSSATSMVIVATIALATMVSNHFVIPIWLALGRQGAVISGDVRGVVLLTRRLSVIGVLALGYLYFRMSGGGAALASIGLISFAGMAQVLPAMLGGVFWRGATRFGAAAGLILGLGVWLWCLFLPSFGAGAILSQEVLNSGPWGIGWLRPRALFGVDLGDPLIQTLLWSFLLNIAGFILGSLLTFPAPLERLQAAQFVNIFEHSTRATSWYQSRAEAEDLLVMSQRIIGAAEAQTIFQRETEAQGKVGYLPDVTPKFVEALERELAGSVGAATAHAMIAKFVEGASVSVEDLIKVADEAAQIMEYSNQLEAKSAEQERTARALRLANNKLTALSEQKDAFLGQISHELRTPMTSIRAFSEILGQGNMPESQLKKYADIIHDETIRLTRLLDDLLDLNVLESGTVELRQEQCQLSEILDRSINAAGLGDARVEIKRQRSDEAITLTTDPDRLSQVFINLLANARKYSDVDPLVVKIVVRQRAGGSVVDIIDNGQGIAAEDQAVIFEKFSRLEDGRKAGGAGLGLAICREIMERLGGGITYLPGQGGGAFRVMLPR